MKFSSTARFRALAVAWLASALSVAAQDAAAPTNTVITSDRLSFDYNRMVAVFDGNVHAQDPEVLITSERLTVFFDSTNDVKSVTALGNVHVYHEDQRAECDQAVYIRRLGQVELTGNPKLFRGKDEISGRKITFWLDDERMLVESSSKLIIHPVKGNKGSAMDVLPGATRDRDNAGTRTSQP